MAFEPCGQVACHTVMRCGVDTVWGEIYFEHVVVAQLKVFGGGCTGGHVVGQHHYAVVALAYTYFVFGTNHAERFHTAYFGFLDFE